MLKIFNKQNGPVKSSIKPTVLLILDGWGMAPSSAGNAIAQARTPNMDRYSQTYPHAELIASGESVGLPANEVGNTEVGHLTIGAGRLILQELKRISKAIEDESFYENQALVAAANHAKSRNSKFHIMGLISTGSVHSSIDHFYAVLEFCKRSGLKNVFVHVFTDGRDSPPNQGIEMVGKVDEYLRTNKLGIIATVSGRYWAMDRDRRWDRTQKTYDALVLGKGETASSATQAIKASYDAGKTDEFVEPTVIVANNAAVATIDDNDAAVFFNFRIDRPRQLTMALTMKDFEKLKSYEFDYEPGEGKIKEKKKESGKTFTRGKVPQNLFFVTMTQYQKNTAASAVSFPPVVARNTLCEVVAAKGLAQFRLAESEKERFISYHLNGLRDISFPRELVKIVPSPKVSTYDKKPQMSLPKLLKEFKRALNDSKYNFFVINFANPDMVAHTGKMKATISALEHVDRAIGEVVASVLASDGSVIITADHGNAEELLSYPKGTFYYTTEKGGFKHRSFKLSSTSNFD